MSDEMQASRRVLNRIDLKSISHIFLPYSVHTILHDLQTTAEGIYRIHGDPLDVYALR